MAIPVVHADAAVGTVERFPVFGGRVCHRGQNFQGRCEFIRMAAINCGMMLQPGEAVEPKTSARMSLSSRTPVTVPELRGDPDLGATNAGVTIVWLT